VNTWYGVYRRFKNGKLKYVSRSVTTNQKLAEEIANDLSRGILVLPDGSTKRIPAHPHVAMSSDAAKEANAE